MQKRALGIVGGMGPLATLDLFGKIIAHTDAKTDAEHIRIYMDCHTGIPDRTKAILEGGESPVPYIVESGQKLSSIGAELLLIPCNTSHYYYEEICRQLPVPVLNMVAETAKALQRDGVTRVGLLATEATCRSGVYQNLLQRYGIDTVCPNEGDGREVMRLIYQGVKADAPTFDITAVLRLLDRLWEQGVERIVLGCTELPIGFDRYGIPRDKTVDPAKILAQAAVVAAGYPCRII